MIRSDILKRLRDAAKMSEALAVLLPHSEGNAMAKLYNEAADAIEELSTQLECLKSCTGKCKASPIAEHDARIAECKREFMEKEQEAHNAFLAMAEKCGQIEPQKE